MVHDIDGSLLNLHEMIILLKSATLILIFYNLSCASDTDICVSVKSSMWQNVESETWHSKNVFHYSYVNVNFYWW